MSDEVDRNEILISLSDTEQMLRGLPRHNKKILHVEPVKDKIDWAALTQEWQTYWKSLPFETRDFESAVDTFWAEHGGRDVYFVISPSFGYLPRVYKKERD